MKKGDSRSFTELISELVVSVEEVSLIAKDSENELYIEFPCLLNKLGIILSDIKDNKDVMDTVTIRKAIESISKELQRAKTLIQSYDSKQQNKWIENVMQDLGRSLGLVLFASVDLHLEMKEKISALHKEFMNVRFKGSLTPSPRVSPSPSPSQPPSPSEEYEFVTATTASEREIEEEITEIEEERVNLTIDDVALQLKYGNDKEFNFALSRFSESIRQGLITNEWINEEGIVLILVNKLSSCIPNNRLIILRLLHKLALENSENKDKMADPASLSTLVKSLTLDKEERREAVGLLLDLSDLPAVWRRLGRIQGCIVMLVTMLNSDDLIASGNAGKLLNALSSNTQNALHMAEAGYFKPLVHYLKEGSDMSKILMATALSRMELTDQSRALLGEAIEPLVKMFGAGKLEAKLSALNSLQNLSNLSENIQRLVNSGIVVSLLQLLFSVTSVLMTLREPASAILSRIAQSESILVNQDVAQQMLSLLNLSSPIIQYHLLQALKSIAGHRNASKVRRKMKENGAIQLLLPFLTETNKKIRTGALDLLYTLSKYLPDELTEQLGESHLIVIVNIISSSQLETDKAAAIGILSNIPISNKKATDVLKKANLLPILISMMNSSPMIPNSLAEGVTGVLIRFTVPSDKRLQLLAAQNEAIPLLVKLLSCGSLLAKCRAVTALGQLSQNSISLRKSKKPSWFCVPHSTSAFCEVHQGNCIVNKTFCLVKAGAILPLIRILEGKEREADEAVLNALSTLLQDQIWENGSDYIAKNGGVEAIIKIMECASVKAQEKGLWILERVFQVEELRIKYGESAQVVLIDLAQNGDSRLKSTTAKLLAQLELLQVQSSYF